MIFQKKNQFRRAGSYKHICFCGKMTPIRSFKIYSNSTQMSRSHGNNNLYPFLYLFFAIYKKSSEAYIEYDDEQCLCHIENDSCDESRTIVQAKFKRN